MAIALVVSACGGGPVATSTTVSTPETVAPGVDLPDADQAIVSAAIADLADRLGVSADEIEVVEFARVTWSDGSLGCPEPGMMYTQALVDGTRTVLGHDGAEYAYHGAGDADPALCERPRPPITQPTR